MKEKEIEEGELKGEGGAATAERREGQEEKEEGKGGWRKRKGR